MYNSLIICTSAAVTPSSLPALDGLDPGTGPVEAASSQPSCPVDGGQQHLSLPHHDGRHDVLQTCADPLLLQRRYDVMSNYQYRESIEAIRNYCLHYGPLSIVNAYYIAFSPRDWLLGCRLS